MRPEDVDLGLLRVLHALLSQRNVTRAAQELGLSQPTVSNALRRLRRHYGDDLLVREGARYVVTPLARDLVGDVEAVLRLADRALDPRRGFDPTTTTRQFSIAMSEYATAVLGPSLVQAFGDRAPHARLDLCRVPENDALDIGRQLRAVDLCIAAPEVAPEGGHFEAALLRDRAVGVAARGNTAVPERPMLAQLAGLAWVALPPDRALTAATSLGLAPRVSISVDNYQALAGAVSRSAGVAFMPQRLAALLAPAHDLRTFETAVLEVPVVHTLWRRRGHVLHAADTWLRAMVRSVAARVAGEDSPKRSEYRPSAILSVLPDMRPIGSARLVDGQASLPI